MLLTFIWPVLEYASPVWHHLITKKQSDQIEAIQKRATRIIYPCAHDMPYTSAVFLADLPTMSHRRDHNLPENFSTPQSSLHPPYITFSPLLGIIHLSLDYESHQNFFASPPEPKIPIPLLPCSLPLLDFVIIVSLYLLCLFSVFVFHDSVQP